MFFEHIEKRFVKQRLSAQNPKKVGALRFGFGNDLIELFGRHPAVLFLAHHPASLAIQVTIVGDRNEVEGWKKFTLL